MTAGPEPSENSGVEVIAGFSLTVIGIDVIQSQDEPS